jgi:hypothetical protein
MFIGVMGLVGRVIHQNLRRCCGLMCYVVVGWWIPAV